MTKHLVIRYEARLAGYFERDQLESIYEIWDDDESACQRAWDLNRAARDVPGAPEYYVREA